MEDECKVLSEIAEIDNELEHIQQNIDELLSKQERLTSRKNFLLENQLLLETKSKDWSLSNFEWSAKIEDLRKKVFHLDSFRPLQLECMNVTMSGCDCILIMPTGGGKSLTFQLPALISPGFTLVISPLVSLMEDQLMSLQEYKINACLLNAGSTRAHVNNVHNNMTDKDSGLKILYVTPEKIAKSKRFMAKLEKAYTGGCLSRIVIDEVHCTSQWGHDFRPDYKILGILKRQFPNCPILGLTATATSRVIEDVKKILNLKLNCVLLKASFNRPNLYYEIRKKPSSAENTIDEIASVIKTQFPGQSGIVYCFSKKDSADVAVGLCSRQISANCYHADLTPESRTKVHHAWTRGKVKVIVATIAFGMGIDKSDVRFVIHHTMSKSMENYYQESGRAGRDGKNAHCILYYSPTDSSRQSCMLFNREKIEASVPVFYTDWTSVPVPRTSSLRGLDVGFIPPLPKELPYLTNNDEYIDEYNDELQFLVEVFTEQTGLKNLYSMLSYCQNIHSCRRSLIGQHFGEEWKERGCRGMCDNCHNKLRNGDYVTVKKGLTCEAQNVLRILQHAQNIGERVTMLKLLEAWQGKGIKKLRIKDLPVPHLTSVDCQRFLIQLLLDNILKEDFHFTPFSTISYLVPGFRAQNVMNRKIPVSMELFPEATTQGEVSRKRDRSKSSWSDIKETKEKKPKIEVKTEKRDPIII